MAVRTAYAGTAADGDVYTAANHARMPGGWIGYVESAGNQAGIGSSEVDLTGLTVTVTVGPSRRIKIGGQVTVSGDGAKEVKIYEDGVHIGRLGISSTSVGTSENNRTLSGACWRSPSSGSHTYKFRALTSPTSSMTVTGSAANSPNFITVEDLGPAS